MTFVSDIDRPFAPPIEPGPVVSTFALPFPPSLNNLFINVPGRGRVPSARYTKWRDEAGWQLKSQRPSPVSGPVFVTLLFEEKKGMRDIDNLAKSVLDLCVTHEIIEGDNSKTVRGLRMQWDGAIVGCRVSISQAAA